eukprot:TRINITY_DN4749_c0_g1_i2.p1 TRINITY_DN4749_c0_g1~~TRINITY_DN4749_c0_g1_i2.p1  ORF type:complete len:233 (-),score=99.50 TRINITY_DN4749_c0_g1_i2:26-724(-)
MATASPIPTLQQASQLTEQQLIDKYEGIINYLNEVKGNKQVLISELKKLFRLCRISSIVDEEDEKIDEEDEQFFSKNEQFGTIVARFSNYLTSKKKSFDFCHELLKIEDDLKIQIFGWNLFFQFFSISDFEKDFIGNEEEYHFNQFFINTLNNANDPKLLSSCISSLSLYVNFFGDNLPLSIIENLKNVKPKIAQLKEQHPFTSITFRTCIRSFKLKDKFKDLIQDDLSTFN